MQSKESLENIRKKERKSHIAMYSNDALYEEGSWLRKPIKTVLDLFPLFEDYTKLRVLDLGCGVGRNCISVAQYFSHIPCFIDCVDILDLAIDKLAYNAEKYQVSQSIRGIVKPIEDYSILANHYDWIMAVSALEHVNSLQAFLDKLIEIRDGIREGGIVCLVINSNVREHQKETGLAVSAQFEVNLPTEEVEQLLNRVFTGWNMIKSTVRAQQYDIPREDGIYELNTNVVTFVAKK